MEGCSEKSDYISKPSCTPRVRCISIHAELLRPPRPLRAERQRQQFMAHVLPLTLPSGLPLWLSWSRICLPCGRPGFDPWVGKIPWRRERLPTPVFLGYPVAQLLKSPPAMWETGNRSPGWEDPLEKGKATHSIILAWRIPWGRKELDTTEWLSLSLSDPPVVLSSFPAYHNGCIESQLDKYLLSAWMCAWIDGWIPAYVMYPTYFHGRLTSQCLSIW